ncbi:MAG: N-acetylglucosamine-6-phosphate deacetylase [Anaerolineales bacterium]
MLLFADVLTPDGLAPHMSIQITDGLIQSVAPAASSVSLSAASTLDLHGCIASPGWVDLQFNGAFGLDFTDNPDALWEVAARLTRYGVTAFLPTIITAPLEVYEYAIEVLRKGPPPGWQGALPLGWHFEGPFLNPGKKGAHNPRYLLPPTPEAIRTWTAANGVRLVTLAPELPGAHALIRQLCAQGVTVSAGHSLATYDEARAAFDAGITSLTHLYNAMPPLAHRDPGLAGAVLTDARITAGLIADGVHCHPSMAALAWRMKGSHGIALVTDAMAALGMPPGTYRLGDFDVTVDETTARLPDGTLAGSILALDQALRNMMAFTGGGVLDFLPALSTTPAALIAWPDYGQIRPGSPANLTVVDRQGAVQAVIIAGRLLYMR